MNLQEHRNSTEVLSILQVADETLAFVKLLSGNIDVGMILEAEESGARWRVLSLGHISAKSHSEGVRGISLEAMDSKSEIHPGMRLIVTN